MGGSQCSLSCQQLGASMLLASYLAHAHFGYLGSVWVPVVGFGEPTAMNSLCIGVLMHQDVEDIAMYCRNVLW